jgi:5'-nucleotidase
MPATSPASAHQERRRRRTNRFVALTAGVVTVGALAAAALPGSASAGEEHRKGGHGHGRYQDVQLLSFNDLHGNLEPPAGSSGRVTETQPDGTTKTIDAGGVEYLATHLRQARKGEKYSITAAGGDMVGASPLISGLFHDEPTIEALNKLDLDVTSVGNHEFDEGAKELARLQNGGCHPKDGCYADK